MNVPGEEQERLLSLLEEEEAKRRSTNRLLKDHRNGERPAGDNIQVSVDVFLNPAHILLISTQ